MGGLNEVIQQGAQLPGGSPGAGSSATLPGAPAHLDLSVKAAQAAAHAALEHGVVVVVGIAQGFLEALQGLLEEAEAQEGIAHAQADLASELGGRPGARQAEAGLAVGDGLVELTQLLVAARQVQVALQEEVGVLQLPRGVDLDHSKLPAAEEGRGAQPLPLQGTPTLQPRASDPEHPPLASDMRWAPQPDWKLEPGSLHLPNPDPPLSTSIPNLLCSLHHPPSPPASNLEPVHCPASRLRQNPIGEDWNLYSETWPRVLQSPRLRTSDTKAQGHGPKSKAKTEHPRPRA